MHCSHCEHDNKDGAKFCNECGAKLELVCATCATVNPPGSKFCNECGARFIEGETAKRGNGEKGKSQPSSQSPAT